MSHAPFDVRPTRSTSDVQIITVVQPAICVVRDPTKIDERGCLGAPELITKTVLPGNLKHDTKTKFDLYEEAGEYAEFGPTPVVTVPGLAIKWSEIFAEPA
jgi:hypothetical protein